MRRSAFTRKVESVWSEGTLQQTSASSGGNPVGIIWTRFNKRPLVWINRLWEQYVYSFEAVKMYEFMLGGECSEETRIYFPLLSLGKVDKGSPTFNNVPTQLYTMPTGPIRFKLFIKIPFPELAVQRTRESGRNDLGEGWDVGKDEQIA